MAVYAWMRGPRETIEVADQTVAALGGRLAPVRRTVAAPGRVLAPVPADRRGRRAAQLLAGLVLYGVTTAMMVLARLGLDPWDVLHQGLARTFGLGIGTWTIIVSIVVLLGWWPLRQRLGVGTVCNAIVIGLVMDVMLAVCHSPHALWARVALLLGGVAGNGLATGFYIGAGLGAGPRDGLSVGIAGRGHSMRVVRTTIEGSVLVTGFVLGGTVGAGTVLYAAAIGPITHVTIPALRLRSRSEGPDVHELAEHRGSPRVAYPVVRAADGSDA